MVLSVRETGTLIMVGKRGDRVLGAVVPAAPDRLFNASLVDQGGDDRVHLGTGEPGPAQYPRRLHRIPGLPRRLAAGNRSGAWDAGTCSGGAVPWAQTCRCPRPSAAPRCRAGGFLLWPSVKMPGRGSCGRYRRPGRRCGHGSWNGPHRGLRCPRPVVPRPRSDGRRASPSSRPVVRRSRRLGEA